MIALACILVALPVAVNQHGAVWDHAHRAVLDGAPQVLTLDRPDADAHRAASLRGIPTKPGYDRDEYPPATSAQGGAGADVEYVRSDVNRREGAALGRQLKPFCDGQRFVYLSW